MNRLTWLQAALASATMAEVTLITGAAVVEPAAGLDTAEVDVAELVVLLEAGVPVLVSA